MGEKKVKHVFKERNLIKKFIPNGKSEHKIFWEYNRKFLGIIIYRGPNPNLNYLGSTKRECS